MNQGSSLFSIFKGASLSKILSGTNKTLGIVKQVVPIYNEVKPMISNAKTFINAYNEGKKPEEIIKKIVPGRPLTKKQPLKDVSINNNLTFFQ